FPQQLRARFPGSLNHATEHILLNECRVREDLPNLVGWRLDLDRVFYYQFAHRCARWSAHRPPRSSRCPEYRKRLLAMIGKTRQDDANSRGWLSSEVGTPRG